MFSIIIFIKFKGATDLKQGTYTYCGETMVVSKVVGTFRKGVESTGVLYYVEYRGRQDNITGTKSVPRVAVDFGGHPRITTLPIITRSFLPFNIY